MKSDTTVERATMDMYLALQNAYDLFNDRLFDGSLPGALITLQRAGKSYGHYSTERFVNRLRDRVDEINLNPTRFATRPVEDTLSTLVHEMVHQYRELNGDPPRRCYHDKIWAAKMKEIGLHPSSTGGPGGNEVGEKMSHYVVPDGRFILACKELLATSLGILWFDRYPVQTGKDYEYAAGAVVTVSKEVIKAAQDPSRSHVQGQLQAQSASTEMSSLVGRLDSSRDADVPVFSPTPVQSGLDVVVERAGRRESGAPRRTDSSNRLKYTCPKCKLNAWAKPLAKLMCGDCRVALGTGS